MKWIISAFEGLNKAYWAVVDFISESLILFIELDWIRATAFTAGPFIIFFIIELVTKNQAWEVVMGFSGVLAGGLLMYKLFKS